MGLPVLQLIVHVGVALILGNLVVHNAMHYVDNRGHLRELYRHHDFDKERLLTRGEQEWHTQVLTRLRVLQHNSALEPRPELLNLFIANIAHGYVLLLWVSSAWMLLLRGLAIHLLLAWVHALAHDVALIRKAHPVLLSWLYTLALGELRLLLLLVVAHGRLLTVLLLLLVSRLHFVFYLLTNFDLISFADSD